MKCQRLHKGEEDNEDEEDDDDNEEDDDDNHQDNLLAEGILGFPREKSDQFITWNKR